METRLDKEGAYMSRADEIGTHKTSIGADGNSRVAVRYWSTDVVAFNDEEIILRDGGHMSATTKLRMNQAARQFGLGYSVYQRDFTWYVKWRGKVLEYQSDYATYHNPFTLKR